MALNYPVRCCLPALSVLLVGIAVTLIVVSTHLQREQERNEQLIKRHAMVYSSAIKQSFRHSQSVVENLVALFNSSTVVSRDKFDVFCRNLFKFQSSVQVLEWIPRVPAHLREHYEITAQ